jgi:hypothetical protein
MDDPDRRLGYPDKIHIGDHQRDLDNAIHLRLEAGHLHIDPDEPARVLGHFEFA